MNLSLGLKKVLLVAFASLLLTACATTKKQTGQLQGDVYTGTDTVEYLAKGVADRVFFATNKSVLTTASRDTLRKQAAWLRKNKDITVTIEGHADERGTREYNLALGERRALEVRDFLVVKGVSGKKIRVVSFGEEKPIKNSSNEISWTENRRVEISLY